MLQSFIRNPFNAATLTICVLSALTIPNFVQIHKAEAESITDCRKLVTGTYLTTNSGDFGSFPSIITFTEDGNIFVTASNQSGVPSIQPYGNVQGSWKCTSDKEITATTFDFTYPTATLSGKIARSDFRATFAPKTGIVQATATVRFFNLNANLLKDNAPVAGRFTFTGQRVKPGQ
ncbi:MAG: hypothetical protein V7L29_01985 [Nostoc sp.]|uniref:hypothetical protein n=1 Tax=Nostoc sp. TaxID=1180 RepID=UPI002FF2B075